MLSGDQFSPEALSPSAYGRAMSAGGKCRCGKQSKPSQIQYATGKTATMCNRCRGSAPGEAR